MNTNEALAFIRGYETKRTETQKALHVARNAARDADDAAKEDLNEAGAILRRNVTRTLRRSLRGWTVTSNHSGVRLTNVPGRRNEYVYEPRLVFAVSRTFEQGTFVRISLEWTPRNGDLSTWIDRCWRRIRAFEGVSEIDAGNAWPERDDAQVRAAARLLEDGADRESVVGDLVDLLGGFRSRGAIMERLRVARKALRS